MTELFDLIAMLRRSRGEPDAIRVIVEGEGGQVIEHRKVSRLVPSPFNGLRAHSMLYEFRCRYRTEAGDLRRGCWYVRSGGDDGGFEWVWHDEDARDTFPISRPGATVASDVVAISGTRDWFQVLGMIFGGLAIVFAVIWFCF